MILTYEFTEPNPNSAYGLREIDWEYEPTFEDLLHAFQTKLEFDDVVTAWISSNPTIDNMNYLSQFSEVPLKSVADVYFALYGTDAYAFARTEPSSEKVVGSLKNLDSYDKDEIITEIHTEIEDYFYDQLHDIFEDDAIEDYKESDANDRYIDPRYELNGMS